MNDFETSFESVFTQQIRALQGVFSKSLKQAGPKSSNVSIATANYSLEYSETLDSVKQNLEKFFLGAGRADPHKEAEIMAGEAVESSIRDLARTMATDMEGNFSYLRECNNMLALEKVKNHLQVKEALTASLAQRSIMDIISGRRSSKGEGPAV